nr:MAG TPA: hypothetical protein [Caudoviricetes sp.]DAM09674.1 MAG TPA: hypothetical protein [Caudoviricetes sp.]
MRFGGKVTPLQQNLQSGISTPVKRSAQHAPACFFVC